MKPTYPEDRLPGWAMPGAALAYWIVYYQLGYWLEKSANQRFSFNTINLKANYREFESVMAKSKAPNGKAHTQGDETVAKRDPVRWINISLTDDDGARLAEISPTIDELSAHFVSLALDGWDISLKRQSKDGSFSATAITDDPHTSGGGVGLSGWSDNPVDALASLLFKIEYKLTEGIPLPSQRPSRRFR